MRMMIRVAILVVGFMGADVAQADDLFTLSGITQTGAISLMTDFKDHGISRSSNNPAGMGHLKLQHSSGIYSRLWGASLANSNASLELHSDVGYNKSMNNILFDIGFRRIILAGSADDKTGENEAFAVLGRQKLFHSDDKLELGITANNTVKFVNVAYDTPINRYFGLTGSIEYATPKTGRDWINYKIGTMFSVSGVGAELVYVGTDIDHTVDKVKNSIVFSLTKIF